MTKTFLTNQKILAIQIFSQKNFQKVHRLKQVKV
jgi:hypothetical protein